MTVAAFPAHVFREVDSQELMNEVLALVARIQVLQRTRRNYPVAFQFINRQGDSRINFWTEGSFKVDVDLTSPHVHDLRAVRLVDQIVREDEMNP